MESRKIRQKTFERFVTGGGNSEFERIFQALNEMADFWMETCGYKDATRRIQRMQTLTEEEAREYDMTYGQILSLIVSYHPQYGIKTFENLLKMPCSTYQVFQVFYSFHNKSDAWEKEHPRLKVVRQRVMAKTIEKINIVYFVYETRFVYREGQTA